MFRVSVLSKKRFKKRQVSELDSESLAYISLCRSHWMHNLLNWDKNQKMFEGGDGRGQMSAPVSPSLCRVPVKTSGEEGMGSQGGLWHPPSAVPQTGPLLRAGHWERGKRKTLLPSRSWPPKGGKTVGNSNCPMSPAPREQSL